MNPPGWFACFLFRLMLESNILGKELFNQFAFEIYKSRWFWFHILSISNEKVLPKLVAKKKKTTKNKLLLTEKIQTSCIKNSSYRKKCKIPIWKRFISVNQQGSQKEGVHLSCTIRTGRANFHTGQVSACRWRLGTQGLACSRTQGRICYPHDTPGDTRPGM